MAISNLFNEELALVDVSKSFTYISGEAGYGENEFSVNGWTVYGGSDAACEHGSWQAMYDMGFRWYSPIHTTRPVSVPNNGVTVVKTQFAMPYSRIFYNYGYSVYSANYPQIQDDFERWRELNCMNDLRRPNGHAWSSIISSIDADDNFFTNNPTYIDGAVGNSSTDFALDTLTGTDYTAVVNRVAAHCLGTLDSTTKRRNFDPSDGCPYDSDQVFGFAKDVVDVIRQTEPNAKLGLYAYANHTLPVAFDCTGLYVQVALGFGSGGLGYNELTRQWGLVVDEVDLRGYGIIVAQDEYYPWEPGICSDSALDNKNWSYPLLLSYGANGVNIESTGNYIQSLVGMYRLIKYTKDGVATNADVRADMLENLSGYGPEVNAVYELWGGAKNQLVMPVFKQVFDLIDQVPEGQWKTDLKDYWGVYCFWQFNVSGGESNRDANYFSKVEKVLGWARDGERNGRYHGYAMARQLANANVKNHGREDMAFDTGAHWKSSTHYPSGIPNGEYEALRSRIEDRVEGRDPTIFDDTTLALVSLSPTNATYNGSKTSVIQTDQDAEYRYIGPGTVTTTAGVTVYGEGIHSFEAKGEVTFTAGNNDGTGILFLNSYPLVSSDTPGSSSRPYIFIPSFMKGRHSLSSSIRWVITDNNKTYQFQRSAVQKEGSGLDDPRPLQAGQSRMNWGLCRGVLNNIKANPWISSHANYQLMPKALAVREGLTILQEFPPE